MGCGMRLGMTPPSKNSNGSSPSLWARMVEKRGVAFGVGFEPTPPWFRVRALMPTQHPGMVYLLVYLLPFLGLEVPFCAKI